MARARVTINRTGVKALLHDKGVKADLHRRAEQVAARAGPDVTIIEAETGGYRAVVQIHDPASGSLHTEARTGRLARALDGAA